MSHGGVLTTGQFTSGGTFRSEASCKCECRAHKDSLDQSHGSCGTTHGMQAGEARAMTWSVWRLQGVRNQRVNAGEHFEASTDPFWLVVSNSASDGLAEVVADACLFRGVC